MKEYCAVDSAVKHKSSAAVVADSVVPLLEDDQNSPQLCKISEPENSMKLDETHDEADVNTNCHYDSITSAAKSTLDVIDMSVQLYTQHQQLCKALLLQLNLM